MTSGPLLCLPLDTDVEGSRKLVAATSEQIDIFKIGLTSYAAGGAELVSEVARVRPVFLDLKLHDIPAQVAGATQRFAGLGVGYLTIHSFGGRDMVAAAVEAAGEDLQVLVVTILTSLSEGGLRELGVNGPSTEAVLRLAEVSLNAGATGLVCSPLEVGPIRSRFGSRADGGPVLVVPGIRLPGGDAHDQKRTATPADAVRDGADVLVVGRAISGASDPAAAAARVRGEMEAA